jgi:hypothetical protein
MFNPDLTTALRIDGRRYRFAPHPAIKTLVWGQEGRRGIVYRLDEVDGGTPHALKVFRLVHRRPGLVDAVAALRAYHELPGMSVCAQTVLTRETHARLIAENEDLEYAILMPWIEGKTWFDYLQARQAIRLEDSRALAESMAWVLYALELNRLAHCDLSSANVIVAPDLQQVHLVDVEDLYTPWVQPPPLLPGGSMGYQHPALNGDGQWGALGDRFAGAVLMAEMLGWAHPGVRRRAYGESYFAPDEMGTNCERFRVLRGVLRVYGDDFAEAFESAWYADGLEGCPPLKTWYDLLDHLPPGPIQGWEETLEAEPVVGRTYNPEPLRVGRAARAEPVRAHRRRRGLGCVQAMGAPIIFLVASCFLVCLMLFVLMAHVQGG